MKMNLLELNNMRMKIMKFNLKLKGLYNWINQKEKLIYIGMDGCWYQFAKVENPNVVWCEVLDSDLHLIEETK